MGSRTKGPVSLSTYVLAPDVRSRGVPGINHRIQAALPITRPLYEPVVLLFIIAAVTTVTAGSTEHFVAVQLWSSLWFLLTTITTVAAAVTNNAFERQLFRSAASFRPRRTCRRGPGGLEGGGRSDYDVTRRSKFSGLLNAHHATINAIVYASTSAQYWQRRSGWRLERRVLHLAHEFPRQQPLEMRTCATAKVVSLPPPVG